MTCRCRTPEEHAQRAREQSAYYSRSAAEYAGKKASDQAAEARRRITELSERAPNPDEFKIIDYEQIDKHLVLKVRYPSCKRCAYDACKVMVFFDVRRHDEEGSDLDADRSTLPRGEGPGAPGALSRRACSVNATDAAVVSSRGDHEVARAQFACMLEDRLVSLLSSHDEDAWAAREVYADLLETRGEVAFADLLRIDARERGGLRWMRHRRAPSRPIVATSLMELASWIHGNRLSVDDASVFLLEGAASHVAGRLRLLSCRAQSARTRAQARWLVRWKIRVHYALAADDAVQTGRLTP